MTNNIKITALFLLTFGATLLVKYAEADSQINFNTYYPIPTGGYDKIQLPKRSTLSGTCDLGQMYVDNSGVLQICQNISGTGTWGPISSFWVKNNDSFTLKDGLTIPQLTVGVGTTTPEFKLSLMTDGGIIAKGTFGSGAVLPNLGPGSRFIWYPKKAALRAGYVSADQWDDANIGNYSAAFGKDSKASGDYTVVLGGDSNTASGSASAVGGGQNNTASGDHSAIVGGKSNQAGGDYAMIWGGENNNASGHKSVILGGYKNKTLADYTIVAGGENNVVNIPYSNINGGLNNTVDFLTGVPAGYSAIGGGLNNTVLNDYSIINGGSRNTTNADFNAIGGGDRNTTGEFVHAGANYFAFCTPDGTCTPSTASADTYFGQYANISGGQQNINSGNKSALLGGAQNLIADLADLSFIGGGYYNRIFNTYSQIAGGDNNYISGTYSTILGGSNNIVTGNHCLAIGNNVKITAPANTFVWGYSDDVNAPIIAGSSDVFSIATGKMSGAAWNPKVGIRDASPTGVLEINVDSGTRGILTLGGSNTGDKFMVLNGGFIGVGMGTAPFSTSGYAMYFRNTSPNAYLTSTGQWTNASSREYKENISPLSAKDAESIFDDLQPVTFKYKTQPGHLTAGFIAEDVPDIVALNDRKSLNPIGILSVLTKIVQEQDKQISDQNQRILELENRVKNAREKLKNGLFR